MSTKKWYYSARARAEYKIAKTYTIYSSHGAVYFTYYCYRNWLFSAEIFRLVVIYHIDLIKINLAG